MGRCGPTSAPQAHGRDKLSSPRAATSVQGVGVGGLPARPPLQPAVAAAPPGASAARGSRPSPLRRLAAGAVLSASPWQCQASSARRGHRGPWALPAPLEAAPLPAPGRRQGPGGHGAAAAPRGARGRRCVPLPEMWGAGGGRAKL